MTQATKSAATNFLNLARVVVKSDDDTEPKDQHNLLDMIDGVIARINSGKV